MVFFVVLKPPIDQIKRCPGVRDRVHTDIIALEGFDESLAVESEVLDAGGLTRELRVQRLPETSLTKDLTLQRSVDIAAVGDSPIWIATTLEDGNQVWTSPIYLFRD